MCYVGYSDFELKVDKILAFMMNFFFINFTCPISKYLEKQIFEDEIDNFYHCAHYIILSHFYTDDHIG